MFEVWSSEDFIHNSLVYVSSRPHSTVLVILLLAVREIPHSSVYIDVSWAGIKVIATFNVPFGNIEKFAMSLMFWAARFLVGWFSRRLSRLRKADNPARPMACPMP